MNNNRGNNRRRGRGNNRQQGGGQPVNRIDSRARGNAPQLLEKYRKLAHDAHLNGDRVTEEYYLQFADHYFRVLADSRQRQEEARARREERWQEGGDAYREDAYRDGEGGGEFGDGEDGGYDAPPQAAPRREREDRPRSEDREERNGRAPRAAAVDRAEPAEAEPGEQRAIFEPAENPFTRDARTGRSPRTRREPDRAEREAPREERRPRRARRAEAAGDEAEATLPGLDSAGLDSGGLDPTTLPPAISTSRAEAAPDPEVAEEAPKPRKRAPRKPKASATGAGETLTPAESE